MTHTRDKRDLEAGIELGGVEAAAVREHLAANLVADGGRTVSLEEQHGLDLVLGPLHVSLGAVLQRKKQTKTKGGKQKCQFVTEWMDGWMDGWTCSNARGALQPNRGNAEPLLLELKDKVLNRLVLAHGVRAPQARIRVAASKQASSSDRHKLQHDK